MWQWNPKNLLLHLNGFRGPHQIEGIGDEFVPEIFEKHRDIVDEIVSVSSNDAIEMTGKIARIEGMKLVPD